MHSNIFSFFDCNISTEFTLYAFKGALCTKNVFALLVTACVLILSASDNFVVKLHLDLVIMNLEYMKAVSCCRNKSCTRFIFQDEAVM